MWRWFFDLPASSHQDPSGSQYQTAATPRRPGGPKVCPLSPIETMPLVRVIFYLSPSTPMLYIVSVDCFAVPVSCKVSLNATFDLHTDILRRC